MSGDVAYCWNLLDVTVTPLVGGEPTHRRGSVLSVLRRDEDNRWRLARDANLLGVSES